MYQNQTKPWQEGIKNFKPIPLINIDIKIFKNYRKANSAIGKKKRSTYHNQVGIIPVMQ